MKKLIPQYNTENIPGQNYELIGIVKGSMIQSKHIGRDISNMLKSIVGGELKGYSEMLNDAGSRKAWSRCRGNGQAHHQ